MPEACQVDGGVGFAGVLRDAGGLWARVMHGIGALCALAGRQLAAGRMVWARKVAAGAIKALRLVSELTRAPPESAAAMREMAVQRRCLGVRPLWRCFNRLTILALLFPETNEG